MDYLCLLDDLYSEGYAMVRLELLGSVRNVVLYNKQKD